MTPQLSRRLAAAITAALGCLQASAATITVTTGGDIPGPVTCTLRQAIDSANADDAGSSGCAAGNGADQIVFAPSLVNSTITLAGSPLTIDSDVGIVGGGQIIDGANASAVMQCGTYRIALSNLTLRNGNAGASAGGGLAIDGSDITIQNVAVVGNTASGGAGIFVHGAAMRISNSTISGNIATGLGEPGSVAAGILSLANQSLTLDHVSITGNVANYSTTANVVAGGIYDFDSSMSISDSTISGNSAANQVIGINNNAVGAIFSLNSHALLIENSTFSYNHATGTDDRDSATGGLDIEYAQRLELRDVTLAQNAATGAHSIVGALRAGSYGYGTPRLTNVTISLNAATATAQDGLAVGGVLTSGPAILWNSIASGNSGATAADVAVADGSDLRSDFLGGALQTSFSGQGNRFGDNPMLQPLADNGGSTRTMALLPGSPAIDAGDNSLLAASDTFDQRGAGYPRVAGASVDMGALEWPGTERDALIRLFIATNGVAWAHNTNWCQGACPASGTPTFNAPGTECSWYGVTCDASQTHVVGLDLLSNDLHGTLPPLHALSALTTLRLSDNALSGPLPDLRSLAHLSNYALNRNQFTGPIPDSLATWPALATFDVSDNGLSGNLPSLSGAGNLREFRAAHAGLAGSIPALAGMPQLSVFDVHSNQLAGALPDLGAVPKLGTFNVANNALSGPVPSLAGHTALQEFDVGSNALSGPLPDLSSSSTVTRAVFANNAFTGGFPNLSGASNLKHLDLSSNRLTGVLPDLSGTHLSELFLQFNGFTGTLPNPPATLTPDRSYLCPNPLRLSPTTHDAAWNSATGQTPWWGPAGGGCDEIQTAGFELLANGSFEHGMRGWHIGRGTCVWQTAAVHTQSAGAGHWPAPLAIDGDAVLIADGQDSGDCTLYQDVVIPSGSTTATLGAAISYQVDASWDPRCKAAMFVTTPAGDLIAPYLDFSSAVSDILDTYPPIQFDATPGEAIRIVVQATNACGANAQGVLLDAVQFDAH